MLEDKDLIDNLDGVIVCTPHLCHSWMGKNDIIEELNKMTCYNKFDNRMNLDLLGSDHVEHRAHIINYLRKLATRTEDLQWMAIVSVLGDNGTMPYIKRQLSDGGISKINMSLHFCSRSYNRPIFPIQFIKKRPINISHSSSTTTRTLLVLVDSTAAVCMVRKW